MDNAYYDMAPENKKNISTDNFVMGTTTRVSCVLSVEENLLGGGYIPTGFELWGKGRKSFSVLDY